LDAVDLAAETRRQCNSSFKEAIITAYANGHGPSMRRIAASAGVNSARISRIITAARNDGGPSLPAGDPDHDDDHDHRSALENVELATKRRRAAATAYKQAMIAAYPQATYRQIGASAGVNQAWVWRIIHASDSPSAEA
jgi:hypothetical protein